MNLGNNKLKIIALLLLLAPAQAISESQERDLCQKIKSAQIVRVDDKQKRVFVQIRPDQISTRQMAKMILLPLQEKITACYPNFGKEWAASFFSDKKYAGYLIELQNEKFVIDGSWVDHYLGEYDRKAQKMTLYPASQKKKKSFTIAIP